MKTFTQALSSDEYTEILVGGQYVAFDMVSSVDCVVILNEISATPDPSDTGSTVRGWPESWDFEATGMLAGTQRVWVKGDNTINGVRG